MVFEIPWFGFSNSSDSISITSTSDISTPAGRASRAGAKAARIVKVVRMIRLVRLVKIYKYLSEKQRKEGTIAPSLDDVVDDLDNMPAESHVGAAMSDRTTKKVIVGILIMLLVIPILQIDEMEYLNEYGLQMVFDRRLDISSFEWEDNGFSSDREEWIAASSDSWKYAEELFISSTSCVTLTYRGFSDGESNDGIIPLDRPLPSTLRDVEKSTLTINDDIFLNNNNNNNNTTEMLQISRNMTAIFDVSPRVKEEAVLGILLTTFVIFLLALGTMTFSRDVNNLVIIPIERMVQLVREISVNPLGKDYLTGDVMKGGGGDDGMETTVLLRTIAKIAGLLRVGFGEAGAEIIGKNLNMSHAYSTNEQQQGGGYASAAGSAINILGCGTKIHSIFAFCDVRNFTDTTECLQEEVMLFVNRIAHILHSVVVQCDGAANKNIGDAFLLTWKMDPKQLKKKKKKKSRKTTKDDDKEDNYNNNDENDDDDSNEDLSGDKALYSLLKTMVEMIRHEDFICNFSASALGSLYERMPGYKCRLGCGLHFGWAVEGAIGSDKKIDASYISPHVNWAEFLEGSTKEYGVPLLMSEPFYELLSDAAKTYCRQVDRIKKSRGERVVGLYTYDANLDVKFHQGDEESGVDDEEERKRLSTMRKNNRKTRRGAIQSLRMESEQQRKTVMTGTRGLRHDQSSRSYHSSVGPKERKSTNSSSTSTTTTTTTTNKNRSSIRKPSILGDTPEIIISEFSTSIWNDDDDIVHLRMHFKTETRVTWNKGMTAFLEGDWNKALIHFNEVLELMGGRDGPSQRLLGVMESYNYSCPEDWVGYCDLS